MRSQNDTEDQAVVQCSPDARQYIHLQESVSSLIQVSSELRQQDGRGKKTANLVRQA